MFILLLIKVFSFFLNDIIVRMTELSIELSILIPSVLGFVETYQYVCAAWFKSGLQNKKYS